MYARRVGRLPRIWRALVGLPATLAGAVLASGIAAPVRAQTTPFAGNGKFSLQGALEAVTQDAIGVQTPKGTILLILLPEQGPPRARDLVASYRVGDEVEIQVQGIKTRYVAADNQPYVFQLRTIRLQGHGSGAQLRAALNSPAWRAHGNLLRPPDGASAPPPPGSAPQPDDPFLAAARAAALRYLRDLPNFLVTETVGEAIHGQVAGMTGYEEVVSELSVADGRERRQNIRLNGRPWAQPFAALPGITWSYPFADRLLRLIEPACGAVFKPAGRSTLNGQPAVVYSFQQSPSLCAGPIRDEGEVAYPGYAGKLYFNPASHLVMRVEERLTDLPGDFGQTGDRDSTNWAPVRIAGSHWLMPAHAESLTSFERGSISLTISYSNYRRFQSTTSIQVVSPRKK